MTLKTLNHNKVTDLTSKIEGPELGEMCKIWRETAVSEMRMKMMSELRKKNLAIPRVC